jgi:hypothetical protein
MVRLTDLDMPVPGLGVRVTGSGPDGQFSFDDVPPGVLKISVQVPLGQARDKLRQRLTQDLLGTEG